MTNTYIQTQSITQIDFVEPNPPELFNLGDIAQGLFRIPRFVGQLSIPYTVGHHSLACAHYGQRKYEGKAPRSLLLHLLLHDAHEAYMGDLPTPLKNTCPSIREVEAKLQRELFHAFGVSTQHTEEVTHIDRMMCRAEAEQYFTKWPGDWVHKYPKPPNSIRTLLDNAFWSDSIEFRSWVEELTPCV